MNIVHKRFVLWCQTTRVQPVKHKRSKNGDTPNMRYSQDVLFQFSPDCLVVRTGPKQEQDTTSSYKHLLY